MDIETLARKLASRIVGPEVRVYDNVVEAIQYAFEKGEVSFKELHDRFHLNAALIRYIARVLIKDGLAKIEKKGSKMSEWILKIES